MGKSGGNLEISMFKHMVLNSIRSYRTKFSSKYGELVIASDTGSSWRKGIFPYYKANRKKDIQESTIDWSGIFEALNEIKNDLEEYFPYRLIQVNTAEADDIIGVLCFEFGNDLPNSEPILIISGDKDFRQLHRWNNIEQYDPVRNRAVKEQNPDSYLVEHIIKGDKGDGIPNMLSADNCLVIGQRQGTISKKRLVEYTNSIKTGIWDNEILHRNYERNKQLIDLSFTPDDLRNNILEQYHSQSGKSRDKIFNYLINNRMKHLMEYIHDF